jgi:outer membrane lipoprotein-sorting protein
MSPAGAAEFSADLVQKMGQQDTTGQAYVKGQKFRMDLKMAGAEQAVVVDVAAKKSLMLMPKEKMYMEMPFDPAAYAGVDGQEKNDQGEWKKVGEEKVAGYDCDKKVFAYKDKSKGELTAWFAKKLNYPIKTVYKDKGQTMTLEYRNIKEGGMADALFTVPGGFHKMDMPAMPGKK